MKAAKEAAKDNPKPAAKEVASKAGSSSSSTSSKSAVGSTSKSAGATCGRERRKDAAATAHDSPERVLDLDGSLANEMMTELHAGNPDAEGVQWPRIAELSLLGALGCGGWLVQLIIDGLESADSPYRFVVAQATDGSIPFYERMGFVRVGAVTASPRLEGGKPCAKKRKKDAAMSTLGEMASRTFEYVTEEGDTVAAIANRYGVEPFDMLFLAQRHLPQLHQHAQLAAGTRLQVPQPMSVEEVAASAAKMRDCWYVLGEDMTMRLGNCP